MCLHHPSLSLLVTANVTIRSFSSNAAYRLMDWREVKQAMRVALRGNLPRAIWNSDPPFPITCWQLNTRTAAGIASDLFVAPATSSLYYRIEPFEGMKAYKTVPTDPADDATSDQSDPRLPTITLFWTAKNMEPLQIQGLNRSILVERWIPDGDGYSQG